MKYVLTRFSPLCYYDDKVIDTRQFPKSSDRQGTRIEVGDMIYPRDGSFAVVLKDGVMDHVAVAYDPLVEIWRVLVTEGNFPIDVFSKGTYPGCRNYHTLPDGSVSKTDYSDFGLGRNNPINDLMCVSEKNPNKILFICSRFVSIVQQEEF